MKTAWFRILSAAAMGLAPFSAPSQMVISAKSGLVNFTEGSVLLDDKAVESSSTKYPEMKENAILRTEAGRAEVLLTPGTILRMGENTGLKMISNRLIDTRVEIQSGSAVVEAVQTAKNNNVTVVVQNGAATLTKAGIYRFDTSPASLKVIRGEAAVEIDGQTTPISTGRMMRLDGSSLAVEKFDTENTDVLDHWSKQRSQLLAMANPSTAKSLMSGAYTGYAGYPGYGYGYGYSGLYAGMGCSSFWGYSTWYATYTYLPCDGYFISPYGFSYWSPRTVGRFFYTGLAHYRGIVGSSPYSYPGTGIRAGGYGFSGGPRSHGSFGRGLSSSRGSFGSTAGGFRGSGPAGHGSGTAGGHSGGGGGHGR